jgi:hypothetical protein
VPAAVLYALWMESVRPMRLGGGPQIGVRGAVFEYVTQFTGAPPALATVAALVAVVIVLAAIWGRRRHGEAWLYIGVLAAPVILIALREPRFLYGRYFLICTPFVLVLMARWMATWRSRWAYVAGVMVVAACLAGQVRLTTIFAQHGRGHHREALDYVIAQSDVAEVVEVGSGQPHDFRDRTLVRFHGRRRARPVRYVGFGHQPPPRWLVYSSDDGMAPDLLFIDDARYVRDRDFPFAGLSGTPWHVYRAATAD